MFLLLWMRVWFQWMLPNIMTHSVWSIFLLGTWQYTYGLINWLIDWLIDWLTCQQQKRAAPVELRGHHPQSADDAKLHTPPALPQVCGALLQGVVPHGPGGTALVPGGAAVGAVLFFTALCGQVISGEGSGSGGSDIQGAGSFCLKQVCEVTVYFYDTSFIIFIFL